MKCHLRARTFKKKQHNGCGSDAVDIIVAAYADFLLVGDSSCNALCCPAHIFHKQRGVQVGQAGKKKGLRRFGRFNTAVDQHLRHKR